MNPNPVYQEKPRTAWNGILVLVLGFVLFSILPILAIGVLAYRNSRASLEKEIINKLNAIADSKLIILQQWQKQVSDVRNLANKNSIMFAAAGRMAKGDNIALLSKLSREVAACDLLQLIRT